MQHEVGSIVEGKVTGITKFGAFIELEGGSVGMVHISEISQSYVNDISEHLTEQQTVKVKILNIGDDGKISLSIKRALPPAQNQGSFQRRENSRPNTNNSSNNGGSSPRNSGHSARQQSSGASNSGGANRSNQNRGTYNNNRGASPSKDNSFEDMLSKFMKTSDEKFSDMKQPERRRSHYKRDNRDYD